MINSLNIPRIENGDLYGFIMLLGAALIALIVSRKFVYSVISYLGFTFIAWCVIILFDLGSIFYLIIGQVATWVIYLVAIPKEKASRDSLWRVSLKANTGKTYYIDNVNMGVGIFGASGSGKSQSAVQSLLEHYAKWNFSGIIHDYKDFELTETAGTIFANNDVNFSMFALHNPQCSVKINIIAPRYIDDNVNKLRGMITNLFLNLRGPISGDPFWRSAAEGAVVATIWRLKKSYPDLCNLPFAVAILLQVKALNKGDQPLGYLIDFLQEDPEVVIKAGSFMTAVEVPKMLASVYSTLTDCLQLLETPNLFYLLSKDDFDLDITNKNKKPGVLSVINKPGVEAVLQAPINAMVIDMMMNLITRDSNPSFILLDEAPTIKIDKLEQRVATLRSYSTSFVYIMQDMIQGQVQWGGKDYFVRSITANLSTQFFGKINDATTGEYYEKFFEYINEKQYSYSHAGMLANGDERITKSYREKRKIRGYEFQRLKPGEFVMLASGDNVRFRFAYKQYNKYDYMATATNVCTTYSIYEYQQKLMQLAVQFIQGGYKDPTVTQQIINQLNH